MPLDLSEHEEVNSELNEFKTKVEVIAKKYAKEHNWCEVVDRALAEIGIEPTGLRAMVDVQVTVQMPISLDSITDLVGKTPEEINTTIAEKMVQDGFVLVPAHQSHGIRYLSTHDRLNADRFKVVDVNELSNNITVNGIPMGYAPMFTSDEGRVSHYVLRSELENRYGTSALCGANVYRWRERSDRDEGRTCAKCQQRARNL